MDFHATFPLRVSEQPLINVNTFLISHPSPAISAFQLQARKWLLGADRINPFSSLLMVWSFPPTHFFNFKFFSPSILKQITSQLWGQRFQSKDKYGAKSTNCFLSNIFFFLNCSFYKSQYLWQREQQILLQGGRQGPIYILINTGVTKMSYDLHLHVFSPDSCRNKALFDQIMCPSAHHSSPITVEFPAIFCLSLMRSSRC